MRKFLEAARRQYQSSMHACSPDLYEYKGSLAHRRLNLCGVTRANFVLLKKHHPLSFIVAVLTFCGYQLFFAPGISITLLRTCAARA